MTVPVEYTCTRCEGEFLMPVGVGNVVLAQIADGFVFDHHPDPDAMPEAMQCPGCRRKIERATPDVR
jgi:DNA-directed RNA polymerase subunit RPC12/RpoP